MNLIISSPHGGHVAPDSVPDRDVSFMNNANKSSSSSYPSSSSSPSSSPSSSSPSKIVYAINDQKVAPPIITKPDDFTLELSLLLADELMQMSGKRPHVVINHLHRRKMDANRNKEEATLNFPEMVEAWMDYHNFIQNAISGMNGQGLFLDMHGQQHSHGWVELGYLIPSTVLRSGDLNSYSSQSSIYHLSRNFDHGFEDLVRGPASLGAFLQVEGIETVPSPGQLSPEGRGYFKGGYNTRRYGSHTGGQIDAIQIESPCRVLNSENVATYAKSLAKAVFRYLIHHQYIN